MPPAPLSFAELVVFSVLVGTAIAGAAIMYLGRRDGSWHVSNLGGEMKMRRRTRDGAWQYRDMTTKEREEELENSGWL